MGYYQKIIRGYVEVIVAMEKLLKKDVKFHWSEQCQEIMYVLKNKMVIARILVFPYWKKEFHAHFDASFITWGIVIVQQGEGSIYHPIAFSSIKLSTVENTYATTEREGLVMV